MLIQFTVIGKPATAGSKRAIPVKRKNGKLGVRVIDDCQAGASWRSVVQDAAHAAYSGKLLRCPIELSATFYVPRPKGHFGSNGLKASARMFPSVKPDTTKLVRAVEDALTGVIWTDDALIVSQVSAKRYGEPARCEIFIRTLPNTVKEDEEECRITSKT